MEAKFRIHWKLAGEVSSEVTIRKTMSAWAWVDSGSKMRRQGEEKTEEKVNQIKLLMEIELPDGFVWVM
jgi:hypothetical protein